jgi:hypothetical protein
VAARPNRGALIAYRGSVAAVTILRFQGVLDSAANGNPQCPTIDGRDVLEEITAAFGYERDGITVGIGNETLTGRLDADEGMAAYSEWTPGEAAKLYIGDESVLDRLEELDGQTVTLIVADESF